MQGRKILLVDESTMRTPYLTDLLTEIGDVKQFDAPEKALSAVKKGLEIDVAVLNYKLSITSLIQAIRHGQPKAKIVAYGAPRMDVPLGVDQYLVKPVLGSELAEVVEKLSAKRRAV